MTSAQYPGSALSSTSQPLHERYDVALCDLDGVLYLGAEPVPHAAQALAAALAKGMRASYVTNNAARSPAEVAGQLADLGMPATPEDVVTSAQAAADLLAAGLPAGSRVLVVGSAALVAEVAQRGLVPVREAGEGADQVLAVVQGHDPQTGWAVLAEAAVALRRGARWVAANTDATLPSPRGPLPGNGSMVVALRHATGATPEVAGKPAGPLFRTAVARSGARRPLFVGDRLDTDIAGGIAAGIDTLLVLTGVADLAAALLSPAGARPAYVSADLRGLSEAHPEVQIEGETSRCGSATARWVNGAPVVDGAGTQALRAQCALAWAMADRYS